MPENPHRPTPTRYLWGIGVLGGVVVAVVLFWQGLDDGPGTHATAIRLQRQTSALLVLAALGAGGLMSLFRRRR